MANRTPSERRLGEEPVANLATLLKSLRVDCGLSQAQLARATAIANSHTSELSEELMVHFAARLRTVRRERGISQTQLARAAGVHPNRISLLERGRQEPGVWTAVRLAAALDVKLSQLAKCPPSGAR
jgi:transcriptional regulator with XRE-family HTH domain